MENYYNIICLAFLEIEGVFDGIRAIYTARFYFYFNAIESFNLINEELEEFVSRDMCSNIEEKTEFFLRQ